MQRLLSVLFSFGAAITVLIGGFYLWIGVRMLLAGNTTGGGMFTLFGVGGIVLALALWSFRRTIRGVGQPIVSSEPHDDQQRPVV